MCASLSTCIDVRIHQFNSIAVQIIEILLYKYIYIYISIYSIECMQTYIVKSKKKKLTLASLLMYFWKTFYNIYVYTICFGVSILHGNKYVDLPFPPCKSYTSNHTSAIFKYISDGCSKSCSLSITYTNTFQNSISS